MIDEIKYLPITDKSNDHITDFIKIFRKEENPDYAILINATWGSGKTFFIKNTLSMVQKDTDDDIDDEIYKLFYISLNGLKSTEEIDKRIAEHHLYLKMEMALRKAPNWEKTKKITKKIGIAAAFALSKVEAVGLKIDVTEFSLENLQIRKMLPISDMLFGKLVVFDDLERTTMEIEELLGYINQFVEHGNQKIIIIADETKIPQINDLKEKLIQKTFLFNADFNGAFSAFVDKTKDKKLKTLLLATKENIAKIINNLGECNLRILKSTIKEFERFYEEFPNENKDNVEAMVEIATTFFEFSYLFKSGITDQKSLTKIYNFLFADKVKSVMEEPSAGSAGKIEDNKSIKLIEYSNQTKLSNRLRQCHLSLEFWQKLIFENYFDKTLFATDLPNCLLFKDAEDLPSWVPILKFWDTKPKDYEAAVIKWKKDYIAVEHTDSGNMLHMFQARSCLQTYGYKLGNLASPKNYISKALKKSGISDTVTSWNSFPASHGRSFDLVDEDFKLLMVDVKSAVNSSEIQNIKAEIGDLTKLLKSDYVVFFEKINSKGSYYQLFPTISYLPIDEFVNIITHGDFPGFVQVFRLIKQRHSASYDNEECDKLESEWLEKVKSKLKRKKRGMTKFQKYWIDNIIEK